MKVTVNNKVVAAIAKEIKGTKYENRVYLVGGFVRDLLLNRVSNDIDLLIEGDINAGIEFARWFCQQRNIFKDGSNPVEYGTYSTAMLHFMNEKIECVAPRSEKYKDDSRNPVVESCTIEEDCFRRDFTVNSMFINISTNELLDISKKGMEDLKLGIIRSTSEPDLIFKQDPLRMLRAIRFAARFNWGIEKETWLGILNNAERIKIISQERITDEINKMLVTPIPSNSFNNLLRCNLLDKILPDVYALTKIGQNKYHFGNAFEHTMAVLDNTKPFLDNRLSALFHDIGKLETRTETDGDVHFYSHEDMGAYMVDVILKKLKYPTDTIKKVRLATKNHMRLKSCAEIPSNKTLRKLQSDLGEDIDMVLDVIDADNNAHAFGYNKPNQINSIRERLVELDTKGKSCSKVVLPINGNDIMMYYDLKATPLIGKLLELVFDAYLEEPEITKEECYEIITKELLK